MNKFGSVAAFVIGAAAGSAVTWVYAKNKYEALIQEEIDSVKEHFQKMEQERKEEDNREEEANGYVKKDAGVVDYMKKIEEKKYGDALGGKEAETVNKPYVISPDEFGEKDEYEQISLTYYSDGVLADEDDEIVEDADSVIGEDSLERFGEYEEDSVFVRNDRLKCDYEILKDQRNYPGPFYKHTERVDD